MLKFVVPQTAVIEKGVTKARAVVGEDNYASARSAGTWTYGLVNGLSPIPPAFTLFPLKIALFIGFLIVFIIGGYGAKSIVGAYLAQAIIIMVMTQRYADDFMRYGLGN